MGFRCLKRGCKDWNVRLAALSTLARLEPLKLCHYAQVRATGVPSR